ncbi:hypothetical protein ACFFX0_03070 [Citricoccus parietis]|uniref:Uncharacterized protein n=1 Tax=Citricoccus parietis TaxID=592307 RepID=A0ABV5FU80_9MICC
MWLFHTVTTRCSIDVSSSDRAVFHAGESGRTRNPRYRDLLNRS